MHICHLLDYQHFTDMIYISNNSVKNTIFNYKLYIVHKFQVVALFSVLVIFLLLDNDGKCIIKK